MRVNLQAQGLWEAIDPDNDDYHNDRMALSAILRAVPPEMLSTLAVKKTAKDAWDTIKTLRMGVQRVSEAKAQTLHKEFDAIKFNRGKSVDGFAMRLTGLVNNLEILGDKIEEDRVIKKFLRVVPPRYSQVAISIETLVDLQTLSVEELTGRLKAVEERYEQDNTDDASGHLLLTEEDWLARMKQRKYGQGSSRK